MNKVKGIVRERELASQVGYLEIAIERLDGLRKLGGDIDAIKGRMRIGIGELQRPCGGAWTKAIESIGVNAICSVF